METILRYDSNLPEPYTKEELEKKFIKYMSGDLKAREEIIIHNTRLIALVISKIMCPKDVLREDLFSIGMIGLMKSVDTFDLNKNINFASYATKCIRNEILMFFRKYHKISNNENEIGSVSDKDGEKTDIINLIPDLSIDIMGDYEKEEIIKIIRKEVESLSPFEKTVIFNSFGFEGKEESEQYKIAEQLGVSQSWISRVKIRTLKKIKNRLIELNIIETSNNILLTKKEEIQVRSNVDRSDTIMKRKETTIKLPNIEEYLINYSKEDRKLMISGLSEKEKDILNKYFFLDGNKPYLEEDVANYFGLTLEELLEKINEIVEKMKIIYQKKVDSNQQREEQGVDDILKIINEPRKEESVVQSVNELVEEKSIEEVDNYQQSENQNVNKTNESKKKGRKVKSVYELFENYSIDEINLMLKQLSDEDLSLLYRRYGTDLENPITNHNFTDEDRKKYYGNLLPKMKRLLPKRENVIELNSVDNPKVTEKEKDDIPILEIFKSYSFREMLNYLTPKEAVIICLRFGYIDNKYYSVTTISNFLGIDELEVLETTKKILLLFKDNINKYIDSTIDCLEYDKKR